jgi:thioredoxin-like negative regulator of GroEL
VRIVAAKPFQERGMSKKYKQFVRVVLCLVAAVAFAGTSLGALAKDKKDETRYPNATRHAPKSDLSSSSDQKLLQAAIDANNSGDEAKAKESAQKVLDSSRSKYAKGIALEVLANMQFNAQDYKGAIAGYQKLIELNSVSNDAYYDAMYNMAAAYIADGQYQPALDELKQWREQGKRDTAEANALEGNVYYRLQKYPEAIAAMKKAMSMTDKPKESWNSILMASYSESGQAGQASDVIEQQLAKDPTNKALAHNALVVYTQANQPDKALALLDREQKQGMISDENDYVSAAKFYASIGQNSAKPEIALRGAALLQQGFDKGAVKASADNYKLLGNSYMIAQKEDQALAAYGKASPLASNGDIDYLRAEILGSQTEWAQARDVLSKGIARGVTHTGKAYLLLGKLNLGLKNRSAAKAAFVKAEQDADTRSEARAELAKLSGKK